MDQQHNPGVSRPTVRRRDFIAVVGGAAIVWPLSARAQQKAMPVIGFLHGGSPGPSAPFVAAFRQGLSDAGYIERKNVTIEYRWAEGRYDRLPALAADLVGQKVDVIATGGGPQPALAAKNATSTIPIVFMGVGNPLDDGVVASLARPVGNITGISILTGGLMQKRLELLSELVPQARVMALLANPNLSGMGRMINDVQEAAAAKGLQVHVLNAATESEIDADFSYLTQLHVDALMIAADPFFFSRREQLVALASRYALPAVYEAREYALAGGLLSYGTSLAANYRQAGGYVVRVLAGAKPADLPVQQPTKFELVINLKTANGLGLTIPQSLLARADEVIE